MQNPSRFDHEVYEESRLQITREAIASAPVTVWDRSVNSKLGCATQMARRRVADGRIALEIDLANHRQVETTRQRINSYYEVGVAGGCSKSARATYKGEGALIRIADWIE